MSIEQRLHAEMRERQAVTQELHAALAELEQARHIMLEGRGHEAELKRQMEERLEREREKREEQMKEKALRRILKRDLARGWTALVAPYLERKRMQTMLRNAGNRLLNPKLTQCWKHWRSDWEVTMRRQETMSFEERMTRQVAELTEQLAAAHKEIEDAKHAGWHGAAAEEEIQRQLDLKLAEEREKRIEHTKQMAVRRVLKRDLAKGWIAWLDMYTEAVRIRRAMKQAGARMLSPQLLRMFQKWRDDMRSEKGALAKMSLSERYDAEVKLRSEVQAQLQNALSELEAARQAAYEGRGQEAELKRQMEERLEAEKAARAEQNAEGDEEDPQAGPRAWLDSDGRAVPRGEAYSAPAPRRGQSYPQAEIDGCMEPLALRLGGGDAHARDDDARGAFRLSGAPTDAGAQRDEATARDRQWPRGLSRKGDAR